MAKRKTIIILGDGMADEPIDALGGKTPLQVAHTPGMDSIAREGRSGTLLTLPQGYPTSSDVANMSVLGCDLPTEYCGRGPLEAMGGGIQLDPDEVAFRVNFTTVEEGILKDFSGGHIEQKEAEALVQCLQQSFGDHHLRFESGVSYRNLLILKSPPFSKHVRTEKPDDNTGEAVNSHLPEAETVDAEVTATMLRELMFAATPILEATPYNTKRKEQGLQRTNGIWPWSGGSAGSIRTLKERYGIRSAVVSAVGVINGLGRCLGMEIRRVKGATGYIDTHYEGKADAALDLIRDHDLVYVHVEALDEVGHARDLQLKIDTLEQFDSRLVQRILHGVSDAITVAVLPDHPVPVRLGTHTRTPVPVSIRMPEEQAEPDDLTTYDEASAPHGALGHLVGRDFMDLLFGDNQ